MAGGWPVTVLFGSHVQLTITETSKLYGVIEEPVRKAAVDLGVGGTCEEMTALLSPKGQVRGHFKLRNMWEGFKRKMGLSTSGT